MGRNQVHELNREHVAAEVAIALAGLRTELWARFRKELGSWRIKPLYAAVFGSAARGDGDEASDIDLLLVHPPFPGERALSRMSKSAMTQLTDAAAHVALGTTDSDPVKRWEGQVERLRGRVESWTGNPLQVIDMSFFEWRHPPKGHADLISEVREDGIELVSAPALGVWPSREIKRG
jgi:predicted nucleotidyltransferase